MTELIFDTTTFKTAIMLKAGEKGLREVAKECGVGHTTVSRLMKGEDPAMDTFVKVVNWLKIPAARFFKAVK